MGIGAWWHWLVVLLIVVLVFGTKKLRNLGGDVGGAVKDFKDAMNAGKSGADELPATTPVKAELIEAKVIEVPAEKPAPKKRAPAKKVVKAKAVPAKAAAKPKAAAEKKTAAKPKAAAAKKSSAE